MFEQEKHTGSLQIFCRMKKRRTVGERERGTHPLPSGEGGRYLLAVLFKISDDNPCYFYIFYIAREGT